MFGKLRFVVKIIGKTLRRFFRNDGSAMAGYIAYISLLAFFPFLIFASALAGMLIGPEQSEYLIETLFNLLPEHIALTILPVAREVLGKTGGGLITLSAVGAIWVASTGFEAFRIAFDRAYDTINRRPFWKNRGIAVIFVFLAVIVFMVLGAAIIVGPTLVRFLESQLSINIPIGSSTLRYGFAGIVLTAFLLLLHRTLPGRRLKVGSLWPGVVATGAICLVAASLFSVYLSFAPNYTITYGALAGVIITLLFFYVTGAAIIFGAELNSALYHVRVAKRREAEKLSAIKDADADAN